MPSHKRIFSRESINKVGDLFKVETLKDLIEDLARVVVEDFGGEITWIGIHPKNTAKMTTDANKHQMLKARLPHNCEFIGEALSFSHPTENYYRLTFKWDANKINSKIKSFGDLKIGFTRTKSEFYIRRVLGKKFLFLDKSEYVPVLTQYFSSKIESLLKKFEEPVILKAYWGGLLNKKELKLEIREISEVDWAVPNRKEKRRRLLREAIDFNLKFFELLQGY
jgi:hypothetical protein